MDEKATLDTKICDLLSLGSGVLSLGVIQAVLPTYSEPEICCALVRLCGAGLVAIDGEGVHLLSLDKGASEASAVSEAEEAPEVVVEALEVSESFVAPEVFEVPEAPKALEASEVPEAIEAPEASEVVEAPKVSEASEAPEEPEAPEALEAFRGPIAEGASIPSVPSIPPLHDGDELLGSSVEPDYSDTYLPDDEIDAMLANMGPMRGARGEVAGSGFRSGSGHGLPLSSHASKSKEFENVQRPLTASSPVALLGLRTRTANYCDAARIRSVGDLVRALLGMPDVRGLGAGSVREAHQKLDHASEPLPGPLTDRQLGALCWLSGCDKFVFDAFDVLCSMPEAEEGARPASPEFEFIAPWERGLRRGRPPKQRRRGVRAVSPQEYFAGFPQEVNDLSLQLCVYLGSRSLPINRDALRVVFLPRLESMLNEHAGDEAGLYESLASLAESIEAENHAVMACACDLFSRVHAMVAHVDEGKFDEPLVIPEGRCWTEAARQAASTSPLLRFDAETRLLTVQYQTLQEWVSSLKEDHARAISLRLEGKTLQETGDDLGITRERVRQIVANELRKRPTLAEDRHRPLFDGYLLTKEQFCTVTGEPGEVYEYLGLTKPDDADRRPLEEAVDDAALDAALRERVRAVADEGFAYVDGVRVPLRRKPVIEALLRKHAQGVPLSLDELLELYRAFIEEHGMDDSEVFEGTGPRALGANLDRWEFVMQSACPRDSDGVQRDIRYYDWASRDFEPLHQALEAFAVEHDGVECSAALLMRDPQICAASDELDLRNEYELHCALRRTMDGEDFVTIKKRPMVQFGEADRNRQVLRLIEEIGPADAYELARVYEERYGVAEATFRGTYLKDFAAYGNDGVYAVTVAELTLPQREYLLAALRGRPYASLEEVRAQFESAFPGVSPLALNDQSLEPLGYTTRGGLIVGEGVNLAEVFGRIMDSREVFGIDDADLGQPVVRNEAFLSELNKRLRAFQVIEYQPDRYVNISAFKRMGSSVTADDLRGFVEAAIDFMEPGRPYSVRSLRTAGFAHPVFDLREVVSVAGEFFFGSLIATGYVGGRIKLTTCNRVHFFCRTGGQLSTPDVVAWEVAQMDAPTEDALIERLRAEHGVEVNVPMLRNLLKRAGIELDGAAEDAELADAAADAGLDDAAADAGLDDDVADAGLDDAAADAGVDGLEPDGEPDGPEPAGERVSEAPWDAGFESVSETQESDWRQ